MSDDVDRRVMDATDALVGAFDALREARLALDDPRLASAADGQRNPAFSQATNRVENSLKRAEEALRRAIVAASTGRNPAHFACYRQADARLAGGRVELRSAGREEDPSGRAARLGAALALVDRGLDVAKDLIFSGSPAPSAAVPPATQADDPAVFAPMGGRQGP
jgi:hypothetical protein